MTDYLDIGYKVAGIFGSIATVGTLTAIFYQIRASRTEKAQRALDTIHRLLSTDTYNEDRDIYLTAVDHGSLTKFVGERSETSTAIRRVLNVHELVAIYVINGVVDEKIARQFCRGWMLQDWKRVSGYVAEARNINGNPKLYLEYEQLAERWSLPSSSN